MKPFLLFAHCRFDTPDPRDWHPNPMIHSSTQLPWHVKAFLEKFQDKFRIIFITTQPKFDKQLLKEYRIEHFIKRDNKGFDFMSWKEGLEYVYQQNYFSQLILCNDSVFLRPEHTQVLYDYLSKDIDYIGLSFNPGYSTPAHIQSMFLIISEKLVKSYIWKHFWANMVHEKIDKHHAVFNNEIGLYQAIAKMNFSYTSLNHTKYSGYDCDEYLNKPNPFIKIQRNELLYMVYKAKYYGY